MVLMKKAAIQGIEYYLPEATISNADLAKDFSAWSATKIKDKTGIETRHVASANECASDLAEKAAKKLFEQEICVPEEIEFILFCTQSPDYFLPTTACLLQERLGISTTAGALDFNLGCSGYVYGLSLAKGLIETGQVDNVLLITAETYSKYLGSNDISTRSIFGDGASATFLKAEDSENDLIGPFVFGTDGSGKNDLIVNNGGMRNFSNLDCLQKSLYMNGPAIFAFTIKSVPVAVNTLLAKCNLSIADIDYFIFHQANEYMLNHLRNKMNIPQEKFCIDLKDYGNTVSSTIPIALADLMANKVISKPGAKIMLVGFGVGYSWGSVLLHI